MDVSSLCLLFDKTNYHLNKIRLDQGMVAQYELFIFIFHLCDRNIAVSKR